MLEIYRCTFNKQTIFLSICLSIFLSIYISIYLTIYLSIYLFIYLFIYLSIYLSIYVYIYLLSIFLSSINIAIYLWYILLSLSMYLSIGYFRFTIYLSIHLYNNYLSFYNWCSNFIINIKLYFLKGDLWEISTPRQLEDFVRFLHLHLQISINQTIYLRSYFFRALFLGYTFSSSILR